MPSLNTISVFSMSEIFSLGSPSPPPGQHSSRRNRTDRSCNFNVAPFSVAILMASTGVNPASTSNSISR